MNSGRAYEKAEGETAEGKQMKTKVYQRMFVKK